MSHTPDQQRVATRVIDYGHPAQAGEIRACTCTNWCAGQERPPDQQVCRLRDDSPPAGYAWGIVEP